MSTIKTTYLQHPSAGSPSLTLASSGAVAINGSMTGAGLDLITTQNFNAVSSVSLDNVFSPTYDNYRAVCVLTSTASAAIRMRLRASGVDNSSNNYIEQLFVVNGTGTGLSRTTTTSWSDLGAVGNNGAFQTALVADFFKPATSDYTTFFANISRVDSGAYIHIVSASQGDAVAFDGFTLFPSSGTFSGSISVYGYKNS